MFKNILIFGAGTLFGAYASVSTVFMMGVYGENCELKKELKNIKKSKREQES